MKLHRGACQVVTLLGLTVISTVLTSHAVAQTPATPGTANAKKTTKAAPAKAQAKAPAKAQAKAPVNAQAKAPVNAQAKAPVNAQAKASVNAQAKAPVNAQAKAPVNAQAKAPVNAQAKAPANAQAKTPAKRRPAPPPPKLADLPLTAENVGVSEGCADSSNLHDVASRIGVDETRLTSLLADQNVDLSDGKPCLRFVALAGGQDGAASVVFERINAGGPASEILVQNTVAGVTSVLESPETSEPDTRVLEASIEELGDSENAFMAGIPASLRWELETIGKQMMDPLKVDGESETPAYSARIAIGKRGESGTDYLRSIEIMESETGRRVDGAWFVERSDGPGVFIGMRGDSYERIFWQSPVQYRRMSRGVGQATTTYRRTVAGSKNTTTGRAVVRTTQVRIFHGGDDLAAPMGSEVHAVGNATVAFAGRRGEFGKLIILDHGLGYQTYYAHLSKIEPEIIAGATVARGETVGRVGSTGHSTGPHLHFETRKDGKYIDSFDDSKELEFWLLTAEDQQRLALRLLSSTPIPAVSYAGIPKF